MKTEDTENKLQGTATIETKEDGPIDVATCPDKPLHRMKLAQTCETCGTLIPSLSGYKPDEYERYFAPPRAEGPSHPFAPDEQNAALWRQHEVAAKAYEDAVFAVEDLRRGRAQLSGRYVGADGNVVEDHSVFARGARADQAIAEAVARREKRREEDGAILAEIQRVDAIRRARHLRALYLESFPEPAPRGVLERIGEAVRGS